jgi:hypothetical protein
MDEQFLQMQYEYYRVGYGKSDNAWMSAPLSYAQWKEKVQSCPPCPQCGGGAVGNKLNWIPYALGGLLVGLYLKKK